MPIFDVPELNTSRPVVPVEPLFAEKIKTAPLLVACPSPPLIRTSPPVPEVLDPPRTNTAPPIPPVELDPPFMHALPPVAPAAEV